MVTYTPSLSIAASKNAENAINSEEQLIPSDADEISPSEKRREAALKGWSRIREQKEKNGGKLKKTRITPSRAAATASTTAASAVPTQPKVQKRASAARSATSIAKKGWETRRKKAAAAAAAAASNPSPVPSSTKGLSHSDAAKLGWARIREKKEAKKAAAAAAASSKKSSKTNTKGGLSRADAARLGWQRIREKQMIEEAAAKAPPKKKKSLSHSEAAKLGWERIREKKAKENAKETEEATIWKARSKSSKKGWETRRKKAMLGGDGDEEVEEQDGDTDELFAIRSKSSLKGWATRRKKKETAAKAKSKDTAEWQMRSDASKKGWETRKRLKNQGSPDDSEASFGWERKRKMQDLMGGEDTPAEQPRKKAYTSSERSKAAKTGWARAREESFYHQDQPIAGYTYTAERVEWEIKQKMLAAANAEDEESSSEDESSDEEDSSSDEEESDEVMEEVQVPPTPAAEISRDEAANLLLAMFGASAPAVAPVPAAKVDETSFEESSPEVEAAPSNSDAFLPVEDNEMAVAEEISMRGRKRKPSVKGSGYTAANPKKQMHQGYDSVSNVKSTTKPSAPKSSRPVGRPKGSLSAPKSPTKAAAKKLSKAARCKTAKQGWQKRKEEVFKQPKLEAHETEQINSAIAVVDKAAAKASKVEMPLPRGVTVRPSGKWQAQLYYAGKSRYIGVFECREDACYAYEVAREILSKNKDPKDDEVERNIGLARKAAFAGVRKN